MHTKTSSILPSPLVSTENHPHRCRPLRIEQAGALWFVTTRTIEERFWLHPILSCGLSGLNRRGQRLTKTLERLYHQRITNMVRAANRRMAPHQPTLTVPIAKRMLKDLVTASLARAQAHCRQHDAEVDIFAFVAMSNHVHLVLRTRGKALAKFMGYFKARVAESINYVTGRRGPLFARRYDAQPILNDQAASGRVAYTVDNPRKASLVSHHDDWAGSLLCFGLHDSDQPAFEYLARTDWHQARGDDRDLPRFFRTVTLTLSPLPHLTDIQRSEYRRMVEGWIGDLDDEAEAAQRKGPKPATGFHKLERLLSIPFEHRPEQSAFKRRPYAFGTPHEKADYLNACSLKYGVHHEASVEFRTANRNVAFPEGMYPPPLLAAA
jgi:REP element-mobilizing transposase RayT